MLILAAALALSSPTIAGTTTVSGFAPDLAVTGLPPRSRVRLHGFRMFTGWERAARGGWEQVPKPLHAWGDFTTDRQGAVRVRRDAPSAGTYRGIDPYGLLWSGRAGTGDVAGFDAMALKPDETRIVVTVGDRIVAQSAYVGITPPGLTVGRVAQDTLNGVYAAPADGARHPTVILLHGSEGGDTGTAREIATRFAGQGYAAFALNYFAWDLKGLNGVPNAHINQPIELLERVRDWLAKRPETDVTRIGLYGHSKGAEFAEVAAVRLPWVRAVAACVPTDAVWEGYGIGDERNRPEPGREKPVQMSSFSWQGEPLPYIPLGGDRKPYRTNTDFYEARRRANPGAAAAALIEVERSPARFLWIGGGRDEVWASGAMARRLDARMRRAGAGVRSELRVYPAAGHGICGEGSHPTRLWAGDSTDPRDPDRDAEGRATVDAWNRIKSFFVRTLR